jgi:lipopolysaccharide/colanic/teichoic acid biosynthesis glycosyltransferase
MTVFSTMLSGWRYRIGSLLGAAVLSAVVVYIANLSVLQSILTTWLPPLGNLDVEVLTGSDLLLATATTLFIVLGMMIPLYKPRPHRTSGIVFITLKRVGMVTVTLAAIGYFDYTYRLPRTTLILATIGLAVTLPTWFVLVGRRPETPQRGVIVGSDLRQIDTIIEYTNIPIIRHICRLKSDGNERTTGMRVEVTDGGKVETVTQHSPLSRLDDVLVEEEIDTAFLAFERTDRGEFFGALQACHEHGVTPRIPKERADRVLTGNTELGTGELVEVDIEPWDWQDRLFKRLFDIAFSVVGLVVLAPIMAAVAVAIKLDSEGPVLYSQFRTAEMGDTFRLYKFRTMVPEGADSTPKEDEENERITRVGRFLRRTHLDEIPQLWSILTGEMSVVGPRAVWVDEELHLQNEAKGWRQRWFVKPGLTGLAQINDAGSTEPYRKLRYDLDYIRRQSFWLDVRIVVSQIVRVLHDLVGRNN